MREYLGQFGETLFARAEWGRARPLVARQPVLDVAGVIGPGLLAVVDHVDPRRRLFFHDVFYRARHGGIEITRIRAAFLLGQQQIDYFLGTRQAPRVGREYLSVLRFMVRCLPPYGEMNG